METFSTFYRSKDGRFVLYHGDCLAILPSLTIFDLYRPDIIFADPPYFLSNGGTTCRGGKRASVDKGDWDQPSSVGAMHAFNRRWLEVCGQALRRPCGTIWVTGTRHVIFSIGFAMQELGWRILNQITWEKPNPPPNLSCKCFTDSAETVIWASPFPGMNRQRFNYEGMRRESGGKQMKTVWQFPSPSSSERNHGRHPTQKPLALLERIIRAATNPGDLVLDPFTGSGTTGVAAASLGRRFIGIDQEETYLEIAVRRFTALSSR